MLASASVACGVCPAASHDNDGHWAASVTRSTDASIVLERDAEHSGPRLLVRQTRAREASDASDAGEFDRWLFG
jgi:hypothetical protein